MTNIPLFGSSASLISPPGGTVTSGYLPLQYLPAENLNYYLNGTTQAVQEIVSLIQFAGLSPSSALQLLPTISGILTSAFAGTYVNKLAITSPATLATLTILAAKTFTVNKSLTLDGTDGKTLTLNRNITLQGAVDAVADVNGLISGYLQGLTMAYVSTTSFSVGTGSIGDSTFVNTLTLLATTTKTTSAWAVGSGNGGLDTGAIASNTWYAVYLIKRTDTNVVDVIYSTNGTSPSLPANYTLFRRIGWVLTNGSSQFVKWFQRGRQFIWDVKVADLSAATPGSTNRILLTVSCPPSTDGLFVIIAPSVTNSFWFDSGWTSVSDSAASATNAIARFTSTGVATGSHNYDAQVDGSRQIYYRVDAVTGNTLTLLTLGWIDNL